MRRIIERVVTVVTTTTWKITWEPDPQPAPGDPSADPAATELPSRKGVTGPDPTESGAKEAKSGAKDHLRIPLAGTPPENTET